MNARKSEDIMVVAVEGFWGGNVVKKQQARTSSFLNPTVESYYILISEKIFVKRHYSFVPYFEIITVSIMMGLYSRSIQYLNFNST